ncbi:MAG: DUF4011 domain-containing protein, partial [Methanomassiliicoccales archaeon]|nr:DUF4011 domain-containing protein [Methanomassiliicoccales archaeon]
MNDAEQLVANKVDLWKSKLLDVSNRNPLIKFRKHKGSTLTVASPDPATLYRELDQGREYTVVSDPGSDVKGARMLVTAHAPEQPVDKVLYNLRSRSKTYRSDHGVSILFIAVGSLIWKEEGNDEPNESPLFLVPVALERQNSFSPYRLVPVDEDAVFNPSLRKRLEMDYRLKLPDFDLENGFDLQSSLERVRSFVPPSSGWQVTATSYLALFHFSKLLMYADLDNGIASLASSPVIRALAGDPSALPPEPSDMPSPQDFDSRLRPEDSFQVLDADSSQQEAVQAALAGVSFVLQGPPGTGKSQTITNIMAELMARGKRILFVSQKMAALDVVKGNLVKCGLGDRCLELHDPKRNRSEIVKEIATSLETVGTIAAPNEVRDLVEVRRELADYVRALHAPRGRLQGMNVFRMIGSYSSYPEAKDLKFHLLGALDVDDERLGRMDASVHRLSQMASAFHDGRHPWSGAIITDWSDRLQAKVLEELASLLEARDKMFTALPSATQALKLPTPEALPDVRRMRQLYRDLAERPKVRREWLEADLEMLASMAEEGSTTFLEVSDQQNGLLGLGSRDILDLDGKTFRHRFDVEYSGALRALNGGFRRDMKILQAIAGRSLSYPEARNLVAAVDRYQRSLADWKVKREGLLSALKGSFSGDGNELPGLVERLNWTKKFRTSHAILLNRAVLDAISSEQLPRSVVDASMDLELHLGRFDSALDVLSAHFIPDLRLNGRPLRDASLSDLKDWSDKAWEGRYRYQEWLDLSSLITGMEAMGLTDL